VSGYDSTHIRVDPIGGITIEYGHLETPCPISVSGIKGMGENGAVAPALANDLRRFVAVAGGCRSAGYGVVHSLVGH